jgi:amino acid transporter
MLLGALTLSYRQVIAAFPNGGGAYAVAGRHLGTPGQPDRRRLADHRLRAQRGGSRSRPAVAALTSAFPSLFGSTLWLCASWCWC